MNDHTDFARLALQLERDLVARVQLRALLTAADATVTGRRQELRRLKARIARRSPGSGRAK